MVEITVFIIVMVIIILITFITTVEIQVRILLGRRGEVQGEAVIMAIITMSFSTMTLSNSLSLGIPRSVVEVDLVLRGG